MKPKPSLRLGIDLTGADSPPADLAPAVLRLRELFPSVSFRVYWPMQSTIPCELMSIATSIVHQELPLSHLSTLDRLLRRWGWPSAKRRGGGDSLDLEAECILRIVPQTIGMQDEPLSGLRRFPDSALPLGMKELAVGLTDAFVSCGNTGAMVAAAQFHLPRRSGAKRLALAARVPTVNPNHHVVLADCGATLEPSVDQLLRFCDWALPLVQNGKAAAKPRVGLLNIGREPFKGAALLKEAYQRLHQEQTQRGDFQFVGNVEPSDIWRGEVDLVLASGFAGNLFLKTLETFVRKNPAQAGAAQLLGVERPVFKVHGNSNADELVSAITDLLQLQQTVCA